MRIGFISGDLVEVTNTRQGVSVPDYPVQGYLLERLRDRGHDVVLLSRCPSAEAGNVPFSYHPGENPMEHELDVLFGDRLGVYGSEYESETIHQIEEYTGPIVFHQYVPYTGWAPQFQLMPHLMGSQRRWTIVNRSVDPRKAYDAMTGWNERVRDSVGVVSWRQWEPFLMLDYPWGGEHVTPDLVAPRQYAQGYYGRVPRKEKRAASVTRWLTAGRWSRIVYGPATSSAWVSEATGAVDGGRILHRELPQALTTFNVIVQSPIDKLLNRGQLRYWPHRIVECALAGVFQLFDPGIGIPEFRRWEVRSTANLRWWMDELQDVEALQAGVRLQQELILPHADPTKVMDRLEAILEEAAS